MRGGTVSIGLALLLCLAPPAGAATVEFAGGVHFYEGGVAADHLAIALGADGAAIVFRQAGIQAGGGCAQVDEATASCQVDGAAADLRVSLDAGDDRLIFDPRGVEALERLSLDVDAFTGHDAIDTAGPEGLPLGLLRPDAEHLFTRIAGGGGDDRVRDRSNSPSVTGGDGADRIEVEVTGETAPLSDSPMVGLDAGPGNDLVRASGNTAGGLIQGGDGADTIEDGVGALAAGGDGDDSIACAGNCQGGRGNDVLTGGFIQYGGSDDDVLRGAQIAAYGDACSDIDSLEPADPCVAAPDGDDRIDVYDGAATGLGGGQFVFCGGGEDEVLADSGDRLNQPDEVDADCEDVREPPLLPLP